jgi:two-component system nitrogen regulation sensor histidine kinase NtrY
VLDSNLPRFALDREQIGRVIINLIDNAVASVNARATPTPPEQTAAQWALRSVGSLLQPGHRNENDTEEPQDYIRIETHFDHDLQMASLIVSDSGTGIPDADKPKLFEPYFSTKGAGTGLGLTIVGTIISDHNGYIRVRDNEPHGAMFIIELPISAAFSGTRPKSVAHFY